LLSKIKFELYKDFLKGDENVKKSILLLLLRFLLFFGPTAAEGARKSIYRFFLQKKNIGL